MNEINRETKSDGKETFSLDLSLGTIINDRYRVDRHIGHGGFGTVYLAFDLTLKKKVAVKFLDPRVTGRDKKFHRIRREVNITQKLSDERIVKIFSLEKWGDLHFMVMEYLTGRTLREVLAEKGPLSWQEFKGIFIQILGGVAVLHGKEIIHRDLKPANIMITGENQVKLLDFGLSKEISDTEKTSSLQELVGTPEFMSPEQIQNDPLDHRSDIYQLGLLLYTALSGTHPFTPFQTTMELILKQLKERPPRLRTLGVKCPRLVEYGLYRCLEKNKKHRFADIEDMIAFFNKKRSPVLRRPAGIIRGKGMRALLASFLFLIPAIVIAWLSIDSKTIHSVSHTHNRVSARNWWGVPLWQKDTGQYRVDAAFPVLELHMSLDKKYASHPHTGKPGVIVIMKHPQNKIFHPQISINSREFDDRLMILDRSGREINTHFLGQEFMLDVFHDFSKRACMVDCKKMDIDDDGGPEFIISTKQALGMHPFSITLVKSGAFYVYTNPGHIKDYVHLEGRPDRATFLIIGCNNPVSHLSFIAEVIFNFQEKIYRRDGFPTLYNDPDRFDYYYFLPWTLTIEENNWKKKGEIQFMHRKSGNHITLYRDYSMVVKQGSRTSRYQDSREVLGQIYHNIDSFYKQKVLHKNYQKAYEILLSTLDLPVENPYLKSALLYFKGDLEVLRGDYEQGERTLADSLALHPHNSDPCQRHCESVFLAGNPGRTIELATRKYEGAANFWGLSGVGRDIFLAYCHMQQGEFQKVMEVIQKLGKKATQDISFIEGAYLTFAGKYGEALEIFKRAEMTELSTFTLAEYRLFYARPLLLKNLFAQEPDPGERDRAEEYFKDLSLYSLSYGHLAYVSRAYFLAVKGEKDAETTAHSAFEKVQVLAKGDFFTRLWLFYDAFIYGKTMEILGNRKEARRGYRACIAANPHTGLAKRAAQILADRL